MMASSRPNARVVALLDSIAQIMQRLSRRRAPPTSFAPPEAQPQPPALPAPSANAKA